MRDLRYRIDNGEYSLTRLSLVSPRDGRKIPNSEDSWTLELPTDKGWLTISLDGEQMHKLHRLIDDSVVDTVGIDLIGEEDEYT